MGTCKNRRHLLGLAVEVKLLTVLENLAILLVGRTDERWDTIGHCELILTRHDLRQRLSARSHLFLSVLFRERVALLSFRASCTD